jgi:hypothetical protein
MLDPLNLNDESHPVKKTEKVAASRRLFRRRGDVNLLTNGKRASILEQAAEIGMLLGLGIFFRKVAGIDEATIQKCPETDRIAATQLGFTLCVNFLIVFCVAFFAVSYLKNSSIIVDSTTGTITEKQDISNFLYNIIYLFVASLIAFSVISLDRFIFQSDWFYQVSIKHSFINSVKHKRPSVRLIIGSIKWVSWQFKKILRVAIRLAMALFLALSLGVALELWFFGSQIVNILQREHKESNVAIYNEFEKFKQDYDADTAKLKATLENEIGRWESNEPTKRIDVIENVDSAGQKYQSAIQNNVNRENAEIRTLVPISELLTQRETVEKDLARLRADERSSIRRATRLRNDGTPYFIFTCPAACLQIRKDISVRDVELKGINERIIKREADEKSIRKRYADERDLIVEANKTNIDIIREQGRIETGIRQREINASEEARQSAQNQEMERRKARKTEIENRQENRSQRLEIKWNELKASPAWRPYGDGPIERFGVLLRLQRGESGEAITYLIWGFVALMVFLEVMPVIAKMFFVPPTAYAIKIRAEVARGQNEEFRSETFEDEELNVYHAYKRGERADNVRPPPERAANEG